ncbi:MAG TPA: sialidase family protein [Phycisphaerae bacterium]|nr:sialidase family protein [Phycisphaerae bacterium]
MKWGSGIHAAIIIAVLITTGCRDVPPCTPVPVETPPTVARSNDPAYFAINAIPTDSQKVSYNHVSCIIQLPGGDLMTVWVAGSAEAAADTAIVASRRPVGTSQWSAPAIVADTPDAGDANPTLLVDSSGIVHLFYVSLDGAGNLCLSHVMEETSADAGLTWSAPRQALEGTCTLIKNKPLILRGGRWVLPAYQQAVYQSQFWISDDTAQSWLPAAPLFTSPDSNLQPAVVELADGSLYALMRGTGGALWEGRSTDCARTFLLKERTDLPNPNSGIDLIRLSDGRLLLANNPSPSERTPLSLLVSPDEGVTWSNPITLEDAAPPLAYPSLIQTADGLIHVTWSHQLAFIQHAEFNTAWLDAQVVMP